MTAHPSIDEHRARKAQPPLAELQAAIRAGETRAMPMSGLVLWSMAAVAGQFLPDEYLKTPPTVDWLRALYARAGIAPRASLRADALVAGNDHAVLAAMAADPAIIERPLVETAKGVVLARPPERVREIL